MADKLTFTPSEFKRVQLRPDIPSIEICAPIEDPPDLFLWVDFNYGEEPEKGIKDAGLNTYVISPVTEQGLFSDKYINCTGVVGIGRDKVSGKEIAFISHQDPEFFVNRGEEEREEFLADLKEAIDELQARSEDATVEVVLFGGNSDPTNAASKKSVDYRKSIEILTAALRKCLGCSPTILEGPNLDEGGIDVTVFTQERKISIGR